MQDALLALRDEMLRDFLVETRTEKPAFEDDRIREIDSIRIGPTLADIDFIGSPILRVKVENRSGASVDVMVSATIAGRGGVAARATTVVERLVGHESRWIELDCPAAEIPTSVAWSVTKL